MAPVHLCGVTKKFGQNIVLRDINLEVNDREFLVLVGPSGCGKSTLLRLIAGLEELSDGSIYLGDRQINHLPPKVRDIAMVFQSYALYPHMTVYNNIAFGLRRQRSLNSSPLSWFNATRKKHLAEIDQRVQQVAEALQISHLLTRKPKELSGGQKQRVALGRAIARNPQVFLMDEPLSNLDAQLRSDTRSQIVQLQKQLQVTTIYVTHDQVEAMTMGDRIVVLNKGDIQQVDTPLNIYRQPANAFVAGFMGSPPMNFLPVQVNSDGSLLGESLIHPISIHELSLREVGRDRSFTMGFRPEDLQPATSETAHLEGMVELVEALGSETIVLLKLPDGELRARVSADVGLEHHWQIGDRSFWRFDLNKLYAFDIQSGVTLHHPYK
ncbi:MULTISPECIES: ABC transporter ATP-binding protein [Pseudanabaena]|uniref:Carbohydrate ABC transporter ATP-binding protein, CUT1 family n=2 Tax=Pseudanabaena TaxID=1152 RepID=L8MYU5_9CYAN|nr:MULTISPECIES: ABC transporter ATP-binding protein [Pseudanabaena]ELS31969.1 carbohydrate ABC transporter ATP-binding protein, CUT1 family [Pseudanabaena biceps PCC 7429]MDG3495768.1 ABC transporter ATP-binding protein [Pseudanabaena catenata USMAC16]